MKTCFKCGQEKPLDEFYKHPRMSDGHLGKCKECAKEDVSVNYRARKPQYQLYDRERYQIPERRSASYRWNKEHRARYPEKTKARCAVGNAVRDGRLIRPTRCERCKCTGRIEAHHRDYSKYLDVEWLCTTCHSIADLEVSS